jgi:hypothetical protein
MLPMTFNKVKIFFAMEKYFLEKEGKGYLTIYF